MADMQRSGWSVLAVIALLSGCAGVPSAPPGGEADAGIPEPSPVITEHRDESVAPLDSEADEEAARSPAASIALGTGRFIDTRTAQVPGRDAVAGDITLNFENSAIEDVVKLVLGEILAENYTIDPSLKGTVTLKTTKPVTRDALLPILEEVLKMNGAALVWSEGVYRVTPLSAAVRGAMPPRLRNGEPGYGVQIIQLRYITAKEMMKILEPMLPKENQLLVDEHRNLIVVSGTSRELENWRETAEIFDVDWMSGYSVGVFPLQYADARVLAEELNRIVGQHMNAESSAMVRIEALDRMNSVLVLTPQPRYLDQMQIWIERLDRVGEGPGTRLFTYAVKNRKASELAAVMTDVFGSAGGGSGPRAPSMAPGLTPVTLSNTKRADTSATASTSAPAAEATIQGQSVTLPTGGNVRIVADESNNAILVMATAQDYKVIESALKRLDVQEMQVLIEASILEVTLADELSYGLEWYIKRSNVVRDYTGEGLLDLNAGSGIGPIVPGFSYTLTGANVQAVLNALATDSRLNVISSPSLMVLDNRTARITVGDQVPVRSETATTEGGVIIESIQFKDTGVQLEVKPRINVGGLITLDIRQEVTDVGDRDIATGQRSFRQRNIESSIAIQSGETIMLGGLITENASDSESGVPLLSKIPLLGALFGATEKSNRRTELVVLITPRVVRNSDDARLLTDEFRQRMSNMKQRAEQMLTEPKP